MFNYYLLGGILAAYFVSSTVNGRLRDTAAELAPDVRERVFQNEAKLGWVWRAADFIAIAMILAAMFAPQMTLFAKQSQRILTIAAGLFIFCVANSISAWVTDSIYRREAPGTTSSKSARQAALLITLAELALLGVVVWFVYTRINWSGTNATNSNGHAAESTAEKGVWIPESAALKELSKLPRDYVQGLVDSGQIRTRAVGGKKEYNADDVEKFKNKKVDVIPD